MSTVSNSVNSVNSVNSFNSVNSVNSVNSYSAVLPPSPMVFLLYCISAEKSVLKGFTLLRHVDFTKCSNTCDALWFTVSIILFKAEIGIIVMIDTRQQIMEIYHIPLN